MLERQYLVGRRRTPVRVQRGHANSSGGGMHGSARGTAVKVSPKGASSSLATLLTQGPRLYGIVLEGGITICFKHSFIF